MSNNAYSIAIAGTPHVFFCQSGDTLLRASLRAGVGLPYECNAGACGSCKIELVDGEVDDLYPEATGIKPRERDRGRLLACQSRPRSDCTLKARTGESYLTPHAPQRQACTLFGIRDITHDIREFSFRSPLPARFLAGQYAMLALPGMDAPRAYSMSNNTNEAGIWQFMIRRTPTGRVSRALFALTPGAQVEIDGPYGLAFLREDSPRDIVCVAGGSGLAPMVAILDAAASQRQAPERAAWLFYGGRTPNDVPRINELLGAHCLERGLAWHPVVSAPELAPGHSWHGESGFVHELLPRKLPRPLVDYEYYFAGPPPMIEATVRLLAVEHKVAQSQMHFDRFF